MSKTEQHITIITPCYNEGIIVIGFLERLERVLKELSYTFCVIVVNDGSTDDTLTLLKEFSFNAGNICLNILDLGYNVGHQAAIYQGLLYAQTAESKHFIVMDSDGEDPVTVIPKLLMYQDADIVNVVRGKRSESFLFRLLYKVYKLIFKIITGQQMNFGNFCLINRTVLDHAVSMSFTHFPAFLSKRKGVVKSIVAERELRIGGRSKMGFKKLFYHAYKSFVEYRNAAPDTKMPVYKAIIPEQHMSNANYSR